MTSFDECNYCFAPIRWLPTAAGSVMPVDAEPDRERGNVVFVGGRAGVLGPARARAARAGGQDLYVHHVVSCTHPAAWNKPKPRRGRPAPRKAVRRR